MSLSDNKGMALVMVLSVVLIMVTVALQLHSNERDNMLNAAAMVDRRALDQMTVSGIHLAMAVLTKDAMDNQADSLQEDWADEETMKTLMEQIPFEQGTLTVEIIDELSKIQINALIEQPANQYDDDVTEPSKFKVKQKEIWSRLADKLLTAIELLGEDIADMEETDKDTILDSIKDWLDKDDVLSSLNSAESDHYEELDPPYKCKNGPIDHLSEVRLIKGITPEVFNGIGELGGLGDYITVYGAFDLAAPPDPRNLAPGKLRNNDAEPPKAATENRKYDYPGQININTAQLPVLVALMPGGDENKAKTLIAYREAVNDSQYVNDLTNIGWYKMALKDDPDLSEELLTVSSNIFRIIATAELNGVKASTTAVIRREKTTQSSPWQCKVLNWETE